MLDGEHIADSPWPARVIAPGADPSQCRLKAGTSPVYAVAGEPACFDMEFYDALGQGVSMEPLELDAVLRASQATAIPTRKSKRRTSKGSLTEGESGELHLGLMPVMQSANEQLAKSPSPPCKASVTVEKVGEYSLHVTMQPNHVALQGSPLQLIVTPAPPSAAHCRVLATASELRLRAGERRSFVVRTHDRFNNPCDYGGARISASVSEHLSCSVLDLGNGEYEIEWSCTKAGAHEMTILLDDCAVADRKPIALTVEPNELCVRRSEASGELNETTAGYRSIIRIQGRDEWGNEVLPTSDVGFGISLRGQDSRAPVALTCVDSLSHNSSELVAFPSGGAQEGGGALSATLPAAAGDRMAPRATLHGYWLSGGVFELMYACSGSGSYLLHLWHRDANGGVHELPNSPQLLTVAPAGADPRGSLLFESEQRLHKQVHAAGTRIKAFVQVGDRYGNPAAAAAGEMELFLDGPEGRRYLFPDVYQASGTGHGMGEAPAIGTYQISEELTMSGSYTLSAQVLGDHVVGSPFRLSVCPAPPDGERSTLIAPPHPVIAHEPATFVIQPKDRFGNAIPPDDLEQVVALGAIVARADGPTRPRCAVQARADGSVDITMLATLSGEYRLHVWVGGTQLAACPHTVKVHAHYGPAQQSGSPDAKRSPRASMSPRRTPSSPRSPKSTIDLPIEAHRARGGLHPPPHAPVFTPRSSDDPKAIPASEAPLMRTVHAVSSASYLSRHPSTPRSRAAALAAAEARNRDERRLVDAHRLASSHSPQVAATELRSNGAHSDTTSRSEADATAPDSPGGRVRLYRKAVTPRTSAVASRGRQLARSFSAVETPRRMVFAHASRSNASPRAYQSLIEERGGVPSPRREWPYTSNMLRQDRILAQAATVPSTDEVEI